MVRVLHKQAGNYIVKLLRLCSMSLFIAVLPIPTTMLKRIDLPSSRASHILSLSESIVVTLQLSLVHSSGLDV